MNYEDRRREFGLDSRPEVRVRHLSRSVCCTKCGEAIHDEANGFTERDEAENVIAVYCPDCGMGELG